MIVQGRSIDHRHNGDVANFEDSAGVAMPGSSLESPDNMSAGMQSMGMGADHMSAHGIIHNPFAHSLFESILTPIVGVMSLAGIYIGRKIHTEFNVKAEDLKSKFKKLDTILTDVPYCSKKLHLTPEQRQGYQAYKTVVEEQYKETDFQRVYAGFGSSVTSAMVAAGLVVMPVGAAALFGLSVVGGAHTAHMVRNLKQTKVKIQRATHELARAKTVSSNLPENIKRSTALRIQDAEIRLTHFKKRRYHERRNLFAWGSFTIGAGVLGAVQTVSLATGAGMAFAPAAGGLVALMNGVLRTLIHNNVLVSPRFVPAMPKHAWNSMSSLATAKTQAQWYTTATGGHNGRVLSEEQVHQNNVTAFRKLQISKSYRADYFSSRTLAKRFTHFMLRTRQKVLGYGTILLLSRFTSTMKFNDKVTVSKQHRTQKMDDARINALYALQAVENTPLADVTAHKLINKADKPPLQRLVNAIIETGQADNIAKIIALKVLKLEKKERVFGSIAKTDLETQPEAAEILRKPPEKRSSLETGLLDQLLSPGLLRNRYKDLFTQMPPEGIDLDAEDDRDRLGALKGIKNTPPCCPSAYDSGMIFEYIQKVFSAQNSGLCTDLKDKMYNLVREATDHALLYQTRKSAKEHIAIWSNLSDAYQRARPTELWV